MNTAPHVSEILNAAGTLAIASEKVVDSSVDNLSENIRELRSVLCVYNNLIILDSMNKDNSAQY